MARNKTPVFPRDWLESKPIVIHHGLPALRDFPWTLHPMSLPPGFWGDVQGDGGDIRITKDKEGGKPLHAELGGIDVGRRSIYLVVKLPRIHARSDTSFWVWYKSAARAKFPPANDPVWGSQSVWDGYVGVYHRGKAKKKHGSTK